MGDMVMMTIAGSETKPTLEQSAAQLGVPPSALDRDFGVVLVDDKRHIYTVRVEAHHIRTTSDPHKHISGPYADPPITPFGLPE